MFSTSEERTEESSRVRYQDGLALIPFPTVWPVLCEPCQLLFKDCSFKRDLKRHAVKCRGRPPNSTIDDVKFECKYCQHISDDRRKATTHQATHFGESCHTIVTYPCHQCNQVFATQKATSSHRRQCKSIPALPIVTEETASTEPTDTAASVPFAVTDAAYTDPMTTVTLSGDTLETPLPEPTFSTDDLVEQVAPTEQHVSCDDVLINSEDSATPINLCYSPFSNTSLPDDNNDVYGLLTHANENFDCNAWLQNLIPPKPKVRKPAHRISQRMSPEDLQKLYSKSMRKALMRINFTPEIECKVPREEIFDQMSEQLKSRNVSAPANLWQPCLKNREILSAPFTEKEVQDALKHPNSAAGPDGWTYKELSEVRDFPKMFLEGLHQIASFGKTPDCWRHYNSMLLFKKPDEFKKGQEEELKCFRPIALSNVSYKLLTSMLCKRMSNWLEKNNGISFGQRAAFSRRGVQENTLVVLEALRRKKTVIYLDLSDAFNSVEHSLIIEALKQSECPEWLRNLVQSLYQDCRTTPTNMVGDKLCDQITVGRGVRQGCPLSALLFNLVLDPLIKCATTDFSWCLGYMDDLALIIEDDQKTEQILTDLQSMSSRLGLTFNAKKCGAANTSHQLQINGEPMPRVSEERAYKYLGTEAFTTSVGGLEMCFKEAWTIAERVEVSDLTPMQKLHALRSKVVPMLYHILENSQCSQSQLHRINRSLRRMVKRICYLPERAANAYIHLHRVYGGPGLPDLVLVKATMTLRSFNRAMNLADDFGQRTRHLILRGKSNEDFLSSLNSRSRAGLSELGKEVVMALGRLERYLGCRISIEQRDGYIGCTIDSSYYKDPIPTINRMIQKQGLAVLKGAPNQGRFWSTLAMTPATVRSIYSFHTEMCDWRFTHSARLNLTPLRGTFSWKPQEQQNCRRCQTAKETVAHVLSNCHANRREVIRRHNEVRDNFISAIPSSLTVAKEQRFGNSQPDIVVQDERARKTWIIDVKVTSEVEDSFRAKEDEMTLKYEPLKRAFHIHGYQATVSTLQFGILGGLSRQSTHLLEKIIRAKGKRHTLIRKLASTVVHSSRNIVVQHLTGKKQYY